MARTSTVEARRGWLLPGATLALALSACGGPLSEETRTLYSCW